MGSFQAGSAELRQAGQEMHTVNTELQSQLQQLAAAVDAVDWAGGAQAAFTSLMGRFSEDARKLNDNLVIIADEIAGSADAYDAQEEQASQSLSGITSSLEGL